jgi:hypothetical protein
MIKLKKNIYLNETPFNKIHLLIDMCTSDNDLNFGQKNILLCEIFFIFIHIFSCLNEIFLLAPRFLNKKK